MEVIPVSKIQLRRGPQSDLPGEPTVNPTIPNPGLDVAEMGFTTDTGRLFIGPDPQQGGQTVGRYTFPFQNIEVLTENSRDRLQQFFDESTKVCRTAFIVSSPLVITDPSNNSDWHTLTVPSDDPTNLAMNLVLSDTTMVAAQISYFLYNGAVPVRAGKMTIMSAGNSLTPFLYDDYIVYQRADLTNLTGALDQNMLYGSIQFSAALVADSTGSRIVIQYQNQTTTTPVLYFKVDNPFIG